MANPNLANINQYFSRTTTTLADIGARRNFLENARDSNSLIKINSLLAYNSNTANTGSLTISLYDYSGNISSNIFNVTLAPQSNTITLIDRTNELFLEEGDSLSVSSNISNTISVITSFDTLRENNFDIPYEYLVVAGGGGGGKGGGGAGGLLQGTLSFPSLCSCQYSILIGGGGTGKSYGASAGTTPGSNSLLCLSGSNLLVAVGGGAGAHYPSITSSGSNGGSGGGGSDAGVGSGIGYPGQGNPGALSFEYGAPSYSAGGGGGAGSNGTACNSTGGCGGIGLCISITGSGVYYAGGGGSGGLGGGPGGTGGLGGGGPSADPGTPGTVNTGGGGGGGRSPSFNNVSVGGGGTGGSGVVILRHPSDYNTANTTGTVSVIANVAGYVIYCFTGSGTITPR